MDKFSEENIAKAVELFGKGYNCAQSVCAAWAGCYGLSEKQMLRVSSSFGAGIGRMRKTCGAACGMFILAGLEYGNVGGNAADKQRNYEVVQELARRFTERNGALECADLLSGKGVRASTDARPEERTQEYYRKRPCPKIVEEAARIWLEFLKENEQQ
ncbi:MAG: C_GCAxxG_C_C family protein [Bacteroidales bacterium]|nr:C_GCAxxG_C_C family protein [Bacteroidales bacterium]